MAIGRAGPIMRVVMLAIGRDRNSSTADLVDSYAKRSTWRVDLIEIAARSHGSRSRRLANEAEKLRQAIPEGAAVIALDERGDNLDSRSLADRIDCFRRDGRRAVVFMIGGADGLDPTLGAEADLRLAFGRATWPHRLVRVMLAEQLYRASTILAGHPYHRD